MKKTFLLFFLFFSFVLYAGEECTTAVISGRATIDNAPLIWKNRDTDHLFNRVIFVNEKPYSYIAIANNDEVSGRIVWAGLNETGFAIMNSVAYNLPLNCNEMKDLEGFIMADALRKCRTVDDFEHYLKNNEGRDLGAQSNFGVIDAFGGACLFEVHNHGYKRRDASFENNGYIVNTNFALSGEKDKGSGYLRYIQAKRMFDSREKISHSFIIFSIIRNVDNPLIPILPIDRWRELSNKKPYYVYTYHSIDRAGTACAFVVHGVKSGGDPRFATMWVALGEPLTTIAVPLWVCTRSVPFPLIGKDKAPICVEAMKLKKRMRPFLKGKMGDFLDLTKLDNRQNTGWIRLLREKQGEILTRTALFLRKNPDCNEMKAFQNSIAKEVLNFLKGLNRKYDRGER